MSTITIECTETQIQLLDELYRDSAADKLPNPYMKAFYKPMGCNISVYTSNKVVFQGNDAEEYASIFMPKKDYLYHAGSDEVGTGDYYGPVCVCATIVRKEDQKLLESLGIKDSKQLTDEFIYKIAPTIIKNIPHSLLILDNAKYNKIQPYNNMNAIKAKMHNQAYLNLARKTALPELIVIDQFCPEKNYYQYLSTEEKVVSGITFTTKAENKYPAVACGAIISRYAFLETLKKMEQKYNWTFPKGAGEGVDENARQFVEKYGMDELYNVAKLNFKNTEKIK